jgi:hypothetical protein
MVEILQGGDRDTVQTDAGGAIAQKFEVTNFTEDYSFDADTAALTVTSDVLGTLIRELIQRGIINGTVA